MTSVCDWPTPEPGWPSWLWSVPYDGGRHPTTVHEAIEDGANCQRYAYAVLEQFGRKLPPLRSSDLWEDVLASEQVQGALEPLDIVLFNASPNAWGAHVALLMADDQLLHLCREIGRPAVWTWTEFAARDRYRCVVGAKRVRSADLGKTVTPQT